MEKSAAVLMREMFPGDGWKVVEDAYETCPRWLIFLYKRKIKRWWILSFPYWKMVAVLCLGEECRCYSREDAEAVEKAMLDLGYSTVLFCD